MLHVDALEIEIHIVLIGVRRQAAFTLLAHAQAGDFFKRAPLLQARQGVVQDYNAHAALEKRQEVLLLDGGNGARHVVEQDGVEIGSDGTIVDGARIGRVMRARFHFPFWTVFEQGPENCVELVAAGDDQQSNRRSAARQASGRGHFQQSATAQAVSDHGLRYSFLR